MKSLHLSIIAIAGIVVAGIILFAIFTVSHLSYAQTQQNSVGLSYTECQTKILDQINKTASSIDKPKAISLALNSPEFQSKTSGYKYIFSNMFTNMTWNDSTCDDAKLKDVTIQFSALNNTGGFVKFIQVDENPVLTKVIRVRDVFVERCDENCPPPGPPAAKYPALNNILSVFHTTPSIVHANEIDAAQIEVQNNGNFTLYDVQVDFWNDTRLALHRPDKIDILQPHETKIIRGALSTSNIASGTTELFWQIIAKNETGTIMESTLFQRPLTVEDISRSQEFNYCCRDLDSTSPLKQFKSGIDLDKIQCKENLVLIFKASDSSPACVRPETAMKLEQRGWGTGLTSSALQTSGTHLPASFMPCQTPYPQVSDGIAVLYMPTNSIGKICVRYSNLNNDTTPVGIRIFEANNLTHNASEITTWASGNTIQEGSTTIVYTIKTGNHARFYVPDELSTGHKLSSISNDGLRTNHAEYVHPDSNQLPILLYYEYCNCTKSKELLADEEATRTGSQLLELNNIAIVAYPNTVNYLTGVHDKYTFVFYNNGYKLSLHTNQELHPGLNLVKELLQYENK